MVAAVALLSSAALAVDAGATCTGDCDGSGDDGGGVREAALGEADNALLTAVMLFDEMPV